MKVADFKNFYWDKKELLAFCKQNKILTQGSKDELIARIEYFLSCGTKPSKITKVPRKGPWDSEAEITAKTPVINYKNDAKTRDFFVSQVGNKFKFNHYLRAFAAQTNEGSLSYGDLVKGYLTSLENKKTTIDKQFEYNQFQRDFYKNSPDKTRDACNAAWKLIKSAPGGSSYKDYLNLIKHKDL